MKTHLEWHTKALRSTFVLALLLSPAILGADPIPSAQLQMGVDAMNQRDYFTAIAHFRNAVEAEPQPLTSRLHLANAYITAIQTAPREDRAALTGQAREIYQCVLAEDPSHTLATWNMAVLALNSGGSTKLPSGAESSSRWIPPPA